MSEPQDTRTKHKAGRQDGRLAWSAPVLNQVPIATTAGQTFSNLVDGLIALDGGVS